MFLGVDTVPHRLCVLYGSGGGGYHVYPDTVKNAHANYAFLCIFMYFMQFYIFYVIRKKTQKGPFFGFIEEKRCMVKVIYFKINIQSFPLDSPFARRIFPNVKNRCPNELA